MDIQGQLAGRMQEVGSYFKVQRQTKELSLSKEKAAELAQLAPGLQLFQEQAVEESGQGFAAQHGLAHLVQNADFDLARLQHDGKPILEMSQQEAAELISEDGYFGISKTAERLAQFVILGGGDDLAKVQAGRQGIIHGFKEAEKLWGGQLPEMSYETLNKALEKIDNHIQQLGGSVIDVEV